MEVRGLEGLRLVRLRTLELIAPLSQEDLDFIPASGKWSVGEIADHIVLAADSLQDILQQLISLKRSGQQPFIRRGFTDFDVFFAFLPKSLMPVMEMPLSLVSRFVPENLRNFLIQHRVLPFHAARSGTPRHGLPAQDLKNRLRAQWDKINSVFQDNADLDFQEMATQHPLFGYTSMANLPDLMASHELRHQKQIMSVLSA
jgi:hypothetical protein